jgi:hypothetical protein
MKDNPLLVLAQVWVWGQDILPKPLEQELAERERASPSERWTPAAGKQGVIMVNKEG